MVTVYENIEKRQFVLNLFLHSEPYIGVSRIVEVKNGKAIMLVMK